MSRAATEELDGARVPEGWGRWTLDDLGRWTGGGTPSKGNPAFWDGDIPWVSPKDMKRLKIDDTIDHVSEGAVKGSAAKLFEANSLAFVVRSGILEHTLPICLIRTEATANQDLKILTPSRELNSEWLLYALLAVAETIRRSCRKDGTTVASIDYPSLKAYPMPVPPRAEQDRIVEAIESAMAAVHRANDELSEIERLTETLQSSARAAAFAGSGAPTSLLDEVAVIQSGVTKSPPKAASLKSFPYIRTANVQAGYLDLEVIKEINLPSEKASRYELRDGDVLVLEGGDADKVGRGWIWEAQITGALHQNHVFAVRPNPNQLDPRYLAHFINAPAARTYFLGVAKQTTNLASINKTQLKALPVPIPSIEAQRRRVAELERLLGAAERMRVSLHDRLAEGQALRRSILHHAFTGRLVPQDPNDDPASELLVRIKVEKAEREAELKKAHKMARGSKATRVQERPAGVTAGAGSGSA